MRLDVEAYYRRYGAMVMRRCRRLLGDEAIAAEAMQETFVQLLRRADRLSGEAPSSLLYRIATNVCLNLIREQGRRPRAVAGMDVLEQIASLDDLGARFAARKLLRLVVGGADETTRYAAVLFYVDGLTLEQVAVEVGLSVGAVRKRLARLKESAKPFRELSYV